MRKIVQIDFDEFVSINNEKGKSEAKILAREKYNLSFEQVKRRLLNGTDYCYDPRTRTYKHKEKLDCEAEFMSLEELNKKNFCEPLEKGITGHKGPGSGFDELIQELIKDKIIELSRYISIDHRTRKLFVKTDKLKHDGFSLVEI